MNKYIPITDVKAREVLDSRGNPTVQVEVIVLDGSIRLVNQKSMELSYSGNQYVGTAIVPSGASTGKFEAMELRDEEQRYLGLGVTKVVDNINKKIKKELLLKDAANQCAIDEVLIALDGTENKKKLGANAILGVSMAVARAVAQVYGMPLYRYLGGVNAKRMPVPMMNILNGGRHADNTIDLQEFMIMPIGASSFSEGLRICSEIYHTLKNILKSRGLSTAVGDEGGFAPDLAASRDVLLLMIQAIEEAGYRVKEQVVIAIDAAASELYDVEKQIYEFPGESKMLGQEVVRDEQQMIEYYKQLVEEFPIYSIEDALYEDDWEGWRQLTACLGERVQLVGDDLFVTNTKRLQEGIKNVAGNAILVKVNQIGTVTEAIEAVELAHRNAYNDVGV